MPSRSALGPFTVRSIGLGAMQLPGRGAFGPPRDRDEALRVLRRALELGVDHIDTAQFYGPDIANELIREALHPYPNGLTLVSKVGVRRDERGGWLPAQEPDQLRRHIEDNLAALGTEQLAVVNLRVTDYESRDPNRPGPLRAAQFDRQLVAMCQAWDEGLIAGVGLSNISVEHLSFALDYVEIACVQNRFNLLDRSSQPLLDECSANGIAFVPFFPLGSGFAAVNPVLSNDAVRAAASRLVRTPAQIALAWTLSVAPNVLLIPGTSSVPHLEENLAAGEIDLDGQTRRALDDVGV